MDQSDPSDEDDSQDSEEEFASSEAPAETLLKAVMDIIDSLYRLATKIRNPATRLQSAKARAFQRVDTETGRDVIDAYKILDLQHVKELLREYRALKPADLGCEPVVEPKSRDNSRRSVDLNDHEEQLACRLAQANTFRRQQFGHWRKHRDKSIKETVNALDQLPALSPNQKNPLDNFKRILPAALLPGPKTIAALSRPSTASHLQNPARFGGDDLLSTTSARTVTPRALDVRDEQIEVPSPPEIIKRAAKIDSHFQCPYCFTLCSKSQLQPDAWR